MSKNNRQIIKTGSPVTTIVVGVIIIVLILMLGFLIYTGKINLPFGSASTTSGTSANGDGANSGSGTNTGTDNTDTSTNGSNGSAGPNGSSGSDGNSGDNGSGSGLDIQVSIDPNQPGASVKTTNPNTNTNIGL